MSCSPPPDAGQDNSTLYQGLCTSLNIFNATTASPEVVDLFTQLNTTILPLLQDHFELVRCILLQLAFASHQPLFNCVLYSCHVYRLSGAAMEKLPTTWILIPVYQRTIQECCVLCLWSITTCCTCWRWMVRVLVLQNTEQLNVARMLYRT